MTTTQQLPSNPAIDFANAVLEETDNGREIINMLHDIAQGNRESSTANDRIAASRTLLDRGLGKCPKQGPVLSPVEGSEPDRESAEPDNHTNHSSDAPQTASQSEPDSSRLVTQLDDALNQSLGPVPEVEPAKAGGGGGPALSNVEGSIHFSIQQHILDITNNCRTIMATLTEIYRAPDDAPRVTDFHRVRAGQMLLDRILGIDPNALHGAVCPDCRQGWNDHSCPPVHPERSGAESKDSEEFVPDPGWIETLHEIKRMEDEGIIDNVEYDPFKPMYNWAPKEVVLPYADEIADKFRAELDLQAERRAKRPEIEERRRKKLEEMYPSHSDDNDPPDT